jgi:hypothetical protein
MDVRLVARLDADEFGMVSANDHRRRSLTVAADGRLHIVKAEDLSIVHTWPLEDSAEGWHSTRLDQRIALISDRDRVTLLETAGTARWSFGHAPWSGARESGCAWFDERGRAFAVVPAQDDARCSIVQLDLVTGTPVAEVSVAAQPAGIRPIVRHPDGWVGLSEGEGQDAARAWWVRVADDGGGPMELLEAGWDDVILADVGAAGQQILTTPHGGAGPLTVRSFPDFTVLRQIASPGPDQSWSEIACFVGRHIVARLTDDNETTVAIGPDDRIMPIDVDEGWLVPGADSWLTVGRTRLGRWSLAS